MQCTSPLKARQMPYLNPKTGKNVIQFGPTLLGTPIKLPCGQCMGCRLERSRTWAFRCMHEAQSHEENHFITLTYHPDYLPKYGSLKPSHLQLFFKRLRDRQKVRYFACGEYGELNGRPHYHAIVYGLRLRDLVYSKTKNGFRLYTSSMLNEVWGLGNVEIGGVTFESAAYVARYICKKQLGKNSIKVWYDKTTDQYYSKEDGTLYEGLVPEFVRMSLKPGIGTEFYKKFQSDMYPEGKVRIRGGVSCKTPRYYDGKYEVDNKDQMDQIKLKRRQLADEHPEESMSHRLRAKKIISEAQHKQLPRTLE